MRGIPGSGKSRKVETLIKNSNIPNKECTICSADNHFINKVTNKYVFDKTELKNAHEKCFLKAESAIKKGNKLVFIDNTNVRYSDYRCYLVLGLKHGYDILFEHSGTEWRNNVHECYKRCIHDVEKIKLKRMLEELKMDKCDENLESVRKSLGLKKTGEKLISKATSSLDQISPEISSEDIMLSEFLGVKISDLDKIKDKPKPEIILNPFVHSKRKPLVPISQTLFSARNHLENSGGGSHYDVRARLSSESSDSGQEILKNDELDEFTYTMYGLGFEQDDENWTTCLDIYSGKKSVSSLERAINELGIVPQADFSSKSSGNRISSFQSQKSRPKNATHGNSRPGNYETEIIPKTGTLASQLRKSQLIKAFEGQIPNTLLSEMFDEAKKHRSPVTEIYQNCILLLGNNKTTDQLMEISNRKLWSKCYKIPTAQVGIYETESDFGGEINGWSKSDSESLPADYVTLRTEQFRHESLVNLYNDKLKTVHGVSVESGGQRGHYSNMKRKHQDLAKKARDEAVGVLLSFRRMKFGVGRLDLHGLVVEEAQMVLGNYLCKNHVSCLKVKSVNKIQIVTGHGRGKSGSTGRLRNMVDSFLRGSEFWKSRFSQEDGNDGCFYVRF